ncbi:hypothetical protein MRX96_024870 [Rhipicephalus microplus]
MPVSPPRAAIASPRFGSRNHLRRHIQRWTLLRLWSQWVAGPSLDLGYSMITSPHHRYNQRIQIKLNIRNLRLPFIYDDLSMFFLNGDIHICDIFINLHRYLYNVLLFYLLNFNRLCILFFRLLDTDL